MTSLLNHPDYDPNHLFDAVIATLALKNDAALARALGVAPPVISKMRGRILPIGPALLIRLHEVTGLSIRDLRVLMGDRRRPLVAGLPHAAMPSTAVNSDPPSRTTPDAGDAGDAGGKHAMSDAKDAPVPLSQRPGTNRPPEQVGIYRTLHPNGSDYQVAVAITRNGTTFRKTFAEQRYGGAQETMKLAQAWRDAVIADHPAMPLAQYCATPRVRNTSGMAGVGYRIASKRDKNGKVTGQYAQWEVSIPMGNGAIRRCSFAVKKFGYEGARQRAIEARQAALDALEGVPLNTGPQPRPVSTPDDIAHLDLRLRAHEERRRQEAAAQRSAAVQAQARADEQKALEIGSPNGEPYIYRSEAKPGKWRGGAWMVSFRRLGKQYGKWFFDSTHGGAAGALAAAAAWRDQTFLSLLEVSKAQVLRRSSAATPSGVTGVYRKITKEGGRIAEWWTAVSPTVRGQRSRSRLFSISKYGERQAFELAVKAREAFVAELADVPHLPRHLIKQMAHRLRDAEDSGEPAAPQPESAPTT